MIQKSTILNIADKCNLYSGNVFHIYKGFKPKVGVVGDFVKFSVRATSASHSSNKGDKVHGVLVRLHKFSTKIDGSFFVCKFNSVVSLKKRLNPRGKELVGPCNFKVKRKKFLLSFSGLF